MTAPTNWTALAGDVCRPLDERELAAFTAYRAGDDSGPDAIEPVPDQADVSYVVRWRWSLGDSR